VLNSLLHGLLSLRGWPAYLIPAALCFGEAAIFVGFVLPGEIAVVYGGVLASEHHVSLWLMAVAVVIAAVVGDTVGYLVGRLLGPALLNHPRFARSPSVQRTRAFLRRWGGPAVLFGRFVSIFRALMPGMAGASSLGYPTFLLFNALGGIIWGIAFTFVGYLAGASYEKSLKVVGSATTGALVGAIVLFVAFILWRHLRHRRRRHGRGVDRSPEDTPMPNGVAVKPD
jgi:membrane-associated protein